MVRGLSIGSKETGEASPIGKARSSIPRPGLGTNFDHRPHLLFLVTEDWYFCSHRLPVARAARDAGFRVSVATRVAAHGDRIRAEGFDLFPLSWQRRSANPFDGVRDVLAIARLYRRLRPDLVHHIAIKPAVFGALAAMAAGVPAIVTTLAGRGYALSGNSLPSRLAGSAVRAVLRGTGIGRRAVITVQNPDDAAWLRRAPGVTGVELIPGSGVDLAHFHPLPEPDGPITVAQVSRMLTMKGVEDLVDAVRRVRARGLDLRLLLAGDSDAGSHAAIPVDRLRDWSAEPGIDWLGPVADVRDVWARAHIAVLASHGGEGIPKSLLEAAACGRALVATDVPGSREVARDFINAWLVPPAAPAALADALYRAALDEDRRRRFGIASRAIVDPAYGEEAVAQRTLALYRSLLA